MIPSGFSLLYVSVDLGAGAGTDKDEQAWEGDFHASGQMAGPKASQNLDQQQLLRYESIKFADIQGAGIQVNWLPGGSAVSEALAFQSYLCCREMALSIQNAG